MRANRTFRPKHAFQMAEGGGDQFQAGVTGRMAVAVVVALEEVDVDQGHRQRQSVALRARVLDGESIVEVAAVLDAGQPVDVGHLAQ